MLYILQDWLDLSGSQGGGGLGEGVKHVCTLCFLSLSKSGGGSSRDTQLGFIN